MAGHCRLRPASRADLPALVALELECFSDPWTAAQLESALAIAEAVALIAEIDEMVAGYVLGRIVVDQAEILSVATRPAIRRQGIGRQLLDAFMQRAIVADVETIWLEVRASNTAARAMYGTAGFVGAGIRRGYYQLPVEDAHVLRCDLRGTASSGTALR